MFVPKEKGTPTAGGFDLSHIQEQQEFEVWPENWASATMFIRVATQWRIGFSGPTGLDYSVLFRLMDDEGMSKEDWRIMFDDIRVMEAAALSAMTSRE